MVDLVIYLKVSTIRNHLLFKESHFTINWHVCY